MYIYFNFSPTGECESMSSLCCRSLKHSHSVCYKGGNTQNPFFSGRTTKSGGGVNSCSTKQKKS